MLKRRYPAINAGVVLADAWGGYTKRLNKFTNAQVHFPLMNESHQAFTSST
jgi:hypothetical protein